MRLVLAEEDDVAQAVRSANEESVVLVIDSAWSPLALALARASVAPLAVERAPATRVNAVVVGSAAGARAVDAAIAYLDGASSTTGQVIEVS